MIILLITIIDNRIVRQVLIRKTSGIAHQRKQRQCDTRPISFLEEKNKGNKAIDNAKITKIQEQAIKTAIKEVNAAKDKLQVTKIARAKKSRDGTKKS